MSTLYADRGFLSMNGVEFQDVESISMKVSDGTKSVPTMTRDRRNKGVVKGNREISASFSVAVQNKLASPKIESIDFEGKSVSLTFEHGGDRYTLVDVDFIDLDQGASGVGTEGKKNFNIWARDVIDQVGNSALFIFSV